MVKAIIPNHFEAQVEISAKANPVANGYLVSKGYAWYVFFLLFALMLFDYIDRQIITSLFPYFKQEWDISDTQCGFLVAAVNWSITLFAVPVAVLADRWSRKKTVGLMASVWSLATLACAFTTNFTQLFSARFAIGVGEAGYVPAGNALISALFPQRLRSTLIGIFMGAAPLGGAIGVLLGGWIASHYGWRHAFGVVAVPGLILAILFFFIRDYKTVELTLSASEDERAAGRRPMTRKEVMKVLLRTPSLLAIYFGTVLGLFFCSAVVNWLPVFFMRVHKLPVAGASARAGLILLASVLGSYLGGFLADKLVIRGWINGRPLTAALLQFFSFLVFVAAFGLAQGQSQLILLLLGGMLFSAFMGPVYSSLVELVHPGLRATVISVMTFLQNMLGMALGPIFAGALSDRYGIGTSMIVCSFVPIFSMALYLVGAAFYARDLAKVEKVEIQMER